jgi:hypothetical protein
MIWLYSSPHTLLGDPPADRHRRRRAWLLSGLTALAVPAILGVVAALSGRPWGILIGYALLQIVPLMIGISLVVTATGHARLWLLYLCAPPTLLTALLSVIGPVALAGWALSWCLGVPLLLGVLLSCACAVWVSNQAGTIAREHTRQRPSGPPADLPALQLQQRARLVRLVAAASCGVLNVAVVTFTLLVWPPDRILSAVLGLALLVGAASCLRLEAALLCWLGRPLVALDGQGACATYAGRWALFAPTSLLLPLLIDEQSAMRAGAALMVLLREGSLGPAVRRACARLTSEQAHHLMLSLSLQPGGAGAIRYLAPTLPHQIQDIAATYARLAEEAARPRDLQRWQAALIDRPGITKLIEHGLASDLSRVLVGARDALLCYSYTPTIEDAARNLRQIIPALYGDTTSPILKSDSPTCWPEALLERIVAHERLLGTGQVVGLGPVERGTVP